MHGPVRRARSGPLCAARYADPVPGRLAVEGGAARAGPPGGLASEINFFGNLVGSYTDLCELVLAAQGGVRLHTATYPLDRLRDALTGLDAGRVRRTRRPRAVTGTSGPGHALTESEPNP